MNTETGKKENSILGLFGREKLQELQDSVSAVTNFSVEVIDYRGECVANSNKKNDRQKEDVDYRAQIALEAARAAIENRSSSYLYDGKLHHVILPIIQDKQYLGALVATREECNEQEAQNISRLLQFMVDEVLLQENSTREVYALQRKEIHLRELRKKNRELKVQLAALRAERLRARVLPQFQLSMMMVLSSFAIIEEAEKTEEMVVRSSEILRYYLDTSKEEIFLRNELNQIENYFSLLKEQYNGKFQAYIHCDEEAEKVMIPVLSVFPFVEYITDYGLFFNDFKRTLYLDCEIKEDKCLIHMQLEGGEAADAQARQIQSYIQNTAVAEQMEQAKQRLQIAFGEECVFSIQKNLIQITIPWEAGI